MERITHTMARSVMLALRKEYQAGGSPLAFDEMPVTALKRAMRKLRRLWLKRFDELAPKMAETWAKRVGTNVDQQQAKIMRDHGWTVRFTQSQTVAQLTKAAVAENVKLIKSIPAKYFDDIESQVWSAFTSGSDVQALTKNLHESFGVSYRRAAFIARDQTNKATSARNEARQTEMGITRAVWLHSHAGRKPRPTHVAMNGEEYEIAKGMWDSHEQAWVKPGQLINCRCKSRSIIPALL